MTIIAFLAGSVLGFFCGVIGWIGFDMSLSAAFSLYLAIGLSFGLTALLVSATRHSTALSGAKA